MVVSAKDSVHMNQQAVTMNTSPDPPFAVTYKHLLDNINRQKFPEIAVVEECELPLIDLNMLYLGNSEREACKKEIARASEEWGFFQVINHGISHEILEGMRDEQVKLFKKPFHEKKDLSFSKGSYHWGTPSATSLNHLSWSEAFHVPLSDVLSSPAGLDDTISVMMEHMAMSVSELAHMLANILAEEVHQESGFIEKTCLPDTCYLRLNHYPPCKIYPQPHGIVPHTDSAFLTVVHQDSIGGLQLVKDGRWIAVKPNPQTLVINIGDLFQAWSNNIYKSVEHRVVSNGVNERFSTAYFLCPSHDTVIETGDESTSMYKSFSFGEYKKQVQEDVKIFGHKIGLPRFLAPKPRGCMGQAD